MTKGGGFFLGAVFYFHRQTWRRIGERMQLQRIILRRRHIFQHIESAGKSTKNSNQIKITKIFKKIFNFFTFLLPFLFAKFGFAPKIPKRDKLPNRFHYFRKVCNSPPNRWRSFHNLKLKKSKKNFVEAIKFSFNLPLSALIFIKISKSSLSSSGWLHSATFSSDAQSKGPAGAQDNPLLRVSQESLMAPFAFKHKRRPCCCGCQSNEATAPWFGWRNGGCNELSVLKRIPIENSEKLWNIQFPTLIRKDRSYDTLKQG